ncbi:MAG TPA: ABC transporter ATP-binding protein [Coriobacteriia bacterium]|nr:ABC transporter ATP-binding protein [Coriobacteriia bacterium]
MKSEKQKAIGSDALALEVKGLTKLFGTRKALDNLDLELPQGAFLSIFGPNGAGKTTLLSILSTLARPTRGSISVLGFDINEHPDEVREHIGLISHRSMLYPDLTAEENLLFIARLYGLTNPQARVAELLDAVELSLRRHDTVRTFSRGMTQRLSIARALICDPELIFLDEPYSGLDPHAVDILDGLIARIRDGRSFIMVSHDLQKGFDLSSHVLMLAKGRKLVFSRKEDLDFTDFAEQYRSTVGMGVA